MNDVADSFAVAGEMSKDQLAERRSLAQRLINIPRSSRRVPVAS